MLQSTTPLILVTVEALLAKLEYVASLLSSYENPISDPFPLISPQLALKGIEFRKRQVEKYCIQ